MLKVTDERLRKSYKEQKLSRSSFGMGSEELDGIAGLRKKLTEAKTCSR